MTKEEFILIFGFAFVATSFVYALLAATTTIFYRNKPIRELSVTELGILHGKASVGEKITVFFSNLFSSIIAPPVYIIAIVITLVAYLFTSYTFFSGIGIFIAIIIFVVLVWKFLIR